MDAAADAMPADRCVRVLGATVVLGPGGAASEPSAVQRRLLARLALAAGRPVAVEALIDALWETSPPRTARQAVQNQISRLRTQFGDGLVRTEADGYLLTASTDLDLLRQDCERAEVALTDAPADAFDLADRALALARGPAYSDIAHIPAVASARRMVAAVQSAAENIRLSAAIALGRDSWALAEAERLAAESPHDERRASLLARALHRHGRRAEALAAIGRTRRALRTELGITAGAELAAEEARILDGSPWGEPGPGAAREGPFVGRETELRRILAAIARGNIVTVTGEPGIGVTRVLRQVRSRLVSMDVRVSIVTADEYPHSAVGIIEDILDDLHVTLGVAHSALGAMVQFAQGVDLTQPVVVIVDDAQFLGPAALQTLLVATDVGAMRLILGGNKITPPTGDVEDVPLGPLDQPALAGLARHWGRPDRETVAWLAGQSGGNPLAATILLTMTEPGQLPEGGGMPRQLSSLVDKFLAPLDSAGRRDAEIAAVAGDGFPRAAYEHLPWPTEPNPPADLVMVDANGQQRFRHAAVREALYRSLPPGRAADLHFALGQAARSAGASPGLVAQHLLAAAEIDPEAAIGAARLAAATAARFGAHPDAVRWLDRALAVDPGGDARRTLELQVQRANELRLAGAPGQLDALVTAAEEALHLGEAALVAEAAFALLQLGASSAAGALDPRIGGLVDRVLAVLDEPHHRAPVLAAASLAWSMTGDAARCRALFDEADALETDDAVRMQVLPFAYLALGMPSDLPRRARAAAELTALGRMHDEPRALFEGLQQQFSVDLQRGDGDGMRASLDGMESLIDVVGDVGRRWAVLYCAATVAEIDGDVAACERLAAEAHALFGPVSPDRAAAAWYAQLLPLHLAQERLDEIAPVIAALVTGQPGVPAWHAAHALALAVAGGPGDGHAHARRALDLVQEDFTWLACHVVGGRAAVLFDDEDLARRYYERLAPYAELVCWQGTCSYGPVATVLALLAGKLGAAEAVAVHVRQARALADSLGAPGYAAEIESLAAGHVIGL